MESGSIRFAGIRAIPSGVVDDVENRWLRCRLVTPISPAVESAVFAPKNGDVVGPIKTDAGYHIIKVHELLFGQLDDEEVPTTIQQELYAEWLEQQVEKANVEIALFDSI